MDDLNVGIIFFAIVWMDVPFLFFFPLLFLFPFTLWKDVEGRGTYVYPVCELSPRLN